MSTRTVYVNMRTDCTGCRGRRCLSRHWHLKEEGEGKEEKESQDEEEDEARRRRRRKARTKRKTRLGGEAKPGGRERRG
ncbi:hypothetical protein PoB_003743600 [Plakobranchus ocellatus]|uniref:Uncharacterized protein n=1 Tax=Plakobranchus ocellatus TaxID=259542 RepID=A0AAV4AIC8_9GAST|nr:hypothetical protein PoB_003743600 [Plakobranchus ocellatus]